MYRERPSTAELGAVGAVVWSRPPAPEPTAYRVLPDGCMDLIWRDVPLIAGPDTRAALGDSAPGAAWTGLRLPPGLGPAVFGVPADHLRDQRVPLDAVWSPAEVRELGERLAAAADPGAVLEATAAARLRALTGAPPSRAPAASGERLRRLVLHSARRGRPLTETARAAGLSERQLHRRCLALFGYGGKFLERVLRMQRALALLDGGIPKAEAAARAGYADQPHLSREIRALAGVPLGELRGG